MNIKSLLEMENCFVIEDTIIMVLLLDWHMLYAFRDRKHFFIMVKLPGSDEIELLRENWRVQTGESKIFSFLFSQKKLQKRIKRNCVNTCGCKFSATFSNKYLNIVFFSKHCALKTRSYFKS